MDTSLKLNASWSDVRERMKENNLNLTDEDLVYTPGKEENLLNHLQEKLGKSREEVKMLIESISANSEKAG